MAQSGVSTSEPRAMGDRVRRRTFAVAAVAALVVAIALKLYAAGPQIAERPSVAPRSTAIRTESHPEPGPNRPRSGVAPGSAGGPSVRATVTAEAEPGAAPAVAPRTAVAVQRAAIAFLAGYVPYSYGRATARRIRRAARRLRHELQTAPPRVPAGLARGQPRVISVRATAMLGQGAVDLVARIDDGRRRYQIPLELRQTEAGWLVASIGG